MIFEDAPYRVIGKSLIDAEVPKGKGMGRGLVTYNEKKQHPSG